MGIGKQSTHRRHDERPGPSALLTEQRAAGLSIGRPLHAQRGGSIGDLQHSRSRHPVAITPRFFQCRKSTGPTPPDKRDSSRHQSSDSSPIFFWSAPAKRSGDGALDWLAMAAEKPISCVPCPCKPKRRGASLPAALQNAAGNSSYSEGAKLFGECAGRAQRRRRFLVRTPRGCGAAQSGVALRLPSKTPARVPGVRFLPVSPRRQPGLRVSGISWPRRGPGPE